MRSFFLIVVIVPLLTLLFAFNAFAQTPTLSAKSSSQTIKASVGKYYLSVSGYVSPFASIVLSSNSIFMASTVADPKGNFSIKGVLINEGFSDFCFEVVDVKRIGDSFTCLKIPAATGDTKRDNIFLPPTVGLSARKINPRSSIFASGYSMPNAKVILSISKDIKIEVIADASGFYKYEIKDLASGKYSLFATANYEKKDSEKPSRKKEFESLSAGELISKNLPFVLLIILIGLIILILLIILLSRKMRDKIRGLLGKKAFSKNKGISHLHHDWFLGY